MTTAPPVRVRTAGPAAAPLLAAATGAGGLLLVLWIAFASRTPDPLDRRLYADLHGSRGTAETGLARHLTTIGDGAPLVAVLGLLCLWTWVAWRRWEPFAVTALALVFAGGASTVMKHLAGRERPPAGGWMSSADGNSFPSGHTSVATAGYLALAMAVAALIASPRLRTMVVAAGAGLALAIGWTRVELGVHWPTDVVAGWCVGVGAACVALACWVLAPPTLRP